MTRDELREEVIKIIADIDLKIDSDGKMTLTDNSLSLNDLVLKFDGTVHPKDDDTELDVNFSAPETSLKGLLSLVPRLYKKDFKKLATNGTLAVQGSVKGTIVVYRDELPDWQRRYEFAGTVEDRPYVRRADCCHRMPADWHNSSTPEV